MILFKNLSKSLFFYQLIEHLFFYRLSFWFFSHFDYLFLCLMIIINFIYSIAIIIKMFEPNLTY